MQTPSIQTPSAGIVILHPYVVRLFDIMELTKGNAFVNEEAQFRGVYALHYLVTGKTEARDEEVPLEKVLCGLPVHALLPATPPQFSEKDFNEMKSLLEASIAHWPALGSTSSEGLRESFLLRAGLLTEHDDQWELTVERRSLDILLDTIPFSISLMKFPWMNKVLQVDWRY
jgi:hypothetical protein